MEMANCAVERYARFRSYVGWTDDDSRRLARLAPQLEPYLPGVVEEFYQAIDSDENTRAVLSGGSAQVDRLKQSLLRWLQDLLQGPDDEAYVQARWQVGHRHLQIGLDAVYTHCAMARIRARLIQVVMQSTEIDDTERLPALDALNRRLDLDQAIIDDAYQTVYSRRLQETERLATLGKVAGGLAHELRNPLNVIRTSVYYLSNARQPSPEKHREHLQRIDRNVRQADGVITALSDFARLPSPRLVPVSVAPSIQEALETNPPGPQVEVVQRISADLPPVLADPVQLQIVLGNLIRNARDAMGQGGTLTIEAEATHDGVEIRVLDTGHGIPPEILSRITDPLFSTKTHGLGLGLSIARAIVEKSGGELRVRSSPETGSQFTVVLSSPPLPVPEAKP